MDALAFTSEILTSSFLLASICNLVLTGRLVDINYARTQNVIALVYVMGIVLFLVGLLVVTFSLSYSGMDEVQFELPRITPGQAISRYSFFAYLPFIAFVLNGIKRLRTKRFVVLLTCLCFVPKFMELIVVFSVSDVTLSTINRAYLVPIGRILVTGPVLYALIAGIEKMKSTTYNTSYQNRGSN
jgi:hypothetical protein